MSEEPNGLPKPCVYCGCTLIAIGRDNFNRVYRICVNCNARGPLADTVQEASEAWNHRAIEKE